MITITKDSEKILIWMHRNKVSGAKVSELAGISRSAFNQQLKKDSFTTEVKNALRSLGYKD